MINIIFIVIILFGFSYFVIPYMLWLIFLLIFVWTINSALCFRAIHENTK